MASVTQPTEPVENSAPQAPVKTGEPRPELTVLDGGDADIVEENTVEAAAAPRVLEKPDNAPVAKPTKKPRFSTRQKVVGGVVGTALTFGTGAAIVSMQGEDKAREDSGPGFETSDRADREREGRRQQTETLSDPSAVITDVSEIVGGEELVALSDEVKASVEKTIEFNRNPSQITPENQGSGSFQQWRGVFSVELQTVKGESAYLTMEYGFIYERPGDNPNLNDIYFAAWSPELKKYLTYPIGTSDVGSATDQLHFDFTGILAPESSPNSGNSAKSNSGQLSCAMPQSFSEDGGVSSKDVLAVFLRGDTTPVVNRALLTTNSTDAHAKQAYPYREFGRDDALIDADYHQAGNDYCPFIG